MTHLDLLDLKLSDPRPCHKFDIKQLNNNRTFYNFLLFLY